MLKQMRMLFCKSNRLVRLFSKCSKPVLLEVCISFCTVFGCSYFWTNYKKITFVKVLEKCTKNLIGHSRLAFNNHESNIDC